MVENARQRLNDLKHSQKTVDQSYNLLQVVRLEKNSKDIEVFCILESIQ